MPSLNHITIRGFKSLKDVERLELSSLNVLVGANGAGKSNLIEVIRMIYLMMKSGGLRSYVGGSADAYFHGGRKNVSRIEVRLELEKYGYDIDLTPTDDGFLLIENETLRSNDGTVIKRYDSCTFDAQMARDVTCEDANSLKTAIQNWHIYHFHETGRLAGMRRLHFVEDHERLHEDGCNIAAMLYRLSWQDKATYEHIRQTIQLVFPFFEDFALQVEREDNIRLNWRQKGLGDTIMRPYQLSDGAMRFICLTTALLQPHDHATIILDEPELGLHPEALHILAELIKATATDNQVIVATQSALLLDQFSLKDIITVTRNDEATSFNRLNEKDFSHWLKDYTLGELWVKNVIEGGTAHE